MTSFNYTTAIIGRTVMHLCVLFKYRTVSYVEKEGYEIRITLGVSVHG